MDAQTATEPQRESSRRGSRPLLDAVIALLPLALTYLLTMARDLGTIDSGELATVCARLGVAHPTGYSIYTMLGRIFVLVLPLSPIVAVTLLSTAAALGAAWFVLLLARRAIELVGIGGDAATAWVPRFAALWFGWDRVFWDQATGNEVYSLHLLGVACLLWLGLELFTRRPRGARVWLLPYVAGLAAAHHLTIVFLAPALLWAWLQPGFRGLRGGRALWLGLGLPLLIALLAFSVVLYLPIRASLHPVLNWGGTDSWASFWRHALAAQYRVWFFESAAQFAGNLGGYVASLPGRLFPVLLLLAAWGGMRISKVAGRAAIYFGLVILVTLLWASSYDIHDLAPYYLPIDLVLVVMAAIGTAALLGPRAQRSRARIVVALALACALLQAALPFRAMDRRGDRFVRAHTEAVLASLPEHAVLLSRFWDALVSPWIYLHEVEHARPDVMVVDSELLRRTWYFPELRQWDPSLLPPVEEQLAGYLSDLALFENGKRYDARSIESHYRALVSRIVLAQRPARPGAFTLDVLQDYPREVQATFFAPALPVPEGLCFVLRDHAEDSPRMSPPDPARLFAAGYRAHDRIHQIVVEQWRFMLRSRAVFLRSSGRGEEAAEWEAASARLESLFSAR